MTHITSYHPQRVFHLSTYCSSYCLLLLRFLKKWVMISNPLPDQKQLVPRFSLWACPWRIDLRKILISQEDVFIYLTLEIQITCCTLWWQTDYRRQFIAWWLRAWFWNQANLIGCLGLLLVVLTRRVKSLKALSLWVKRMHA